MSYFSTIDGDDVANFSHPFTLDLFFDINRLDQVAISPILYDQLFHVKVFSAVFMCFQFGFAFFWQKDFGAKAARNMWVKLAPGGNIIKFDSAIQLIQL